LMVLRCARFSYDPTAAVISLPYVAETLSPTVVLSPIVMFSIFFVSGSRPDVCPLGDSDAFPPDDGVVVFSLLLNPDGFPGLPPLDADSAFPDADDVVMLSFFLSPDGCLDVPPLGDGGAFPESDGANGATVFSFCRVLMAAQV